MDGGAFDSVGYLIRRLQQEIRRHMDDLLGQHGITPPQFSALLAIQRQHQVSNAELARLSFVTPQTMVRIIGNLEAAGFIEKHDDPSHGRIIRIELTEHGQRLLDSCQALVSSLDARLVAGLTDEETRLLRRLLAKNLSNLQDV